MRNLRISVCCNLPFDYYRTIIKKYNMGFFTASLSPYLKILKGCTCFINSFFYPFRTFSYEGQGNGSTQNIRVKFSHISILSITGENLMLKNRLKPMFAAQYNFIILFTINRIFLFSRKRFYMFKKSVCTFFAFFGVPVIGARTPFQKFFTGFFIFIHNLIIYFFGEKSRGFLNA